MSNKSPFTPAVKTEFVSSIPSTGTSDPVNLKQLFSGTDKPDIIKVKALIRKNSWPVQHEVRRTLWKTLLEIRFPNTNKSDVYQGFVRDMFGEGDMRHGVSMPRFIGNNLKQYNIDDSAMDKVKEVICVIGVAQPEITHSPYLFSLTCLLLHYMDPEECFSSLSLMLQSKTLAYLPQTQAADEISWYAMVELMRKFSKKCHKFLLLESQDITKVVDSWMGWIFHDLPFTFLVRIMDCFMLEGIKVLYRVALAILSFFFKIKVKPRKDAFGGPLGDEVRRFCRGIETHVTIDQLLQKAFSIRNFSRKELDKLNQSCGIRVREAGKTSPYSSPSHDSFCEPINLEDVGSKLLTGEQWSHLWQWLPARTRLNKPTLLYSTSIHGTSLSTFYNKCEEYEPTLLVIRTTKQNIFGAYCSTEWIDRTRHKKNLSYFGTGETFVFTITPEVEKFDWVGKKLAEKTPNSCQLFQAGDTSCVCIGGGSGVAIQLDEDMNNGRTEKCDTFDSPPLVDTQDFVCGVVEVFGFSMEDSD